MTPVGTTIPVTETRPDVVPVLDGDHERFAHIVHANQPGAAAAKVTEGHVLGTPVVALCGKVFTPSRDASKYPVCPECKEIKAAVQAGRGGGGSSD